MDDIYILSCMRYTEEQLNKLRAVSPRVNVTQISDPSFNEIPQELREQVNILYGWGEHLYQAHRYPNLRWIQTHSAGVNDLRGKPIWKKRDIPITSANGIHAVPMSEHALMMMLAFRWRLRRMLHFQQQNQWPSNRWQHFSTPELRGATLGIVGYGAIGRELGRQADALGMRVLAMNRNGERSPYRGFSQPGIGDDDASIPAQMYADEALLEMLPQCDYVVVLAPLTKATHHMINADALAAMKKSAFLFNLARGPLVDEAALVTALQEGQIAGAGLDVFEEEPLPEESPLWQMDNVIISPHVSGFTPHYDDRASDLFAENLRRFLADEPLINLVKRERGY